MADVFSIEGSGISTALYTFALSSHFDFIIYDHEEKPLFAVEFDGNQHTIDKQQIERDLKKNKLCEFADFPLLRINSLYLKKYRDLDLLAWIIHTWFYRKDFYFSMEKGDIPEDAICDPMMVINGPNLFSYWLSKDIRIKIQRTYDAGRCSAIAPFDWIGVDDENNYRGIATLRINSQTYIFAATGMKSQLFPIDIEIISEILCFEIYKNLEEVLNGTSVGVTYEEIVKKIKTFKQKNHIVSSFHESGFID